MKRDKEHRLSIPRRAVLFPKFMDATFPLERNHGVPWHHCINVQTVRVDLSPLCPIAQVVGVAGGDFVNACKYAKIAIGREMQHAGLLLYNAWLDPTSDRYAFNMRAANWSIDYAAIEAERLTIAIREKIEQRYREWPNAESA